MYRNDFLLLKSKNLIYSFNISSRLKFTKPPPERKQIRHRILCLLKHKSLIINGLQTNLHIRKPSYEVFNSSKDVLLEAKVSHFPFIALTHFHLQPICLLFQKRPIFVANIHLFHSKGDWLWVLNCYTLAAKNIDFRGKNGTFSFSTAHHEGKRTACINISIAQKLHSEQHFSQKQ